MQTAGYSGTPLVKKLGIKSGFRIRIINQPDNYFLLLTDMPMRVRSMAQFIGLVDIRVCAVDETWSALKLVIPVKERN